MNLPRKQCSETTRDEGYLACMPRTLVCLGLSKVLDKLKLHWANRPAGGKEYWENFARNGHKDSSFERARADESCALCSDFQDSIKTTMSCDNNSD
eukprot:5965347-Amphidinium_carterae.2